MVTVTVRGMIIPDGRLEIELPDDFQPGQAEMTSVTVWISPVHCGALRDVTLNESSALP